MSVSCRVCGRSLRSAHTAARGVGPVCARKTGDAAPEPAAPRPLVEHCPGQTVIPLPAPGIPDAVVADIEAALDDAQPGETGRARAERVAVYLASSGWTITPAA